MTAVTIAHLADLHFGYGHLNRRLRNGQNVRENDFERAALACAEHLVREVRPDLVVIAGDLLQFTRVSSTGLNAAITFGRTLTDAGLTVVAIPGNHDEPEAEGRFSDLQTCANHSGITLIQQQQHFDVSGVRLHLVPFRALSRAARGRGELQPFEFSESLPNVLVAHGYAEGPGIPPIRDLDDTQIIPQVWIDDQRFALGCLGHVHRHVAVNDRMFYAGSTERRDFKERDEQPGFWVHTITDGRLSNSRSVHVHDLVPGLPRPMLEITISAAGLSASQLTDRVLSELRQHDITGAMVKLVLTEVSSDIDRSHARQVWQRHFAEAGGFSLEDTVQTRQIAELFDVQFDTLPVNVSDAFQRFLAAQPFQSDEDRRDMLTLAADVMARAHESLISEDVL